MKKQEIICNNCYFYLDAECHRNSPKPENCHAGCIGKADWPQTRPKDWCGDWKLKEEE